MSPISWLTLLIACAKSNPDLFQYCCCPVCGERYRITRHGFYFRSPPDNGGEYIAVQRYCCRCPDCPRRTFSIPPADFLPFSRIPLSQMLMVWLRHINGGQSIQRCAAYLSTGWNTAKRALRTVRKMIGLVRKEIPRGTLPKKPDRPGAWQTFTRIFSYAFFPHRFLHTVTNTKRLF